MMYFNRICYDVYYISVRTDFSANTKDTWENQTDDAQVGVRFEDADAKRGHEHRSLAVGCRSDRADGRFPSRITAMGDANRHPDDLYFRNDRLG